MEYGRMQEHRFHEDFGQKISIYSYLNEFMKNCECKSSRLFFDPGLSYFNSLKHFIKSNRAN